MDAKQPNAKQAEAEEQKEMTLEEAKRWRLICRIAFALLAFLAPTLIIGFRMKLFTAATVSKWSVTAIMLLVIVAWRFKKRIADWVKSWDDTNIVKHILVGLGKVWPFLLMVVVVGVIQWSASKIMGDVLFCLEWTCACELAAYLFIYPFEMKFHTQILRIERKNERKADLKEAIEEMKAEEESEGDGE